MLSRTCRTLFLCLALLAPATGATANAADFNRTDAAFASMMLPHHLSGIGLGKIAAKKAQNAQIRKLGRQIASTQTREAGILRSLVSAFRTKPSSTPEIDRRDAMDMAKLRRASGAKFDRTWLDVISSHHMGAIQMAQMEKRGGTNGRALRLAGKIIVEQRSELRQFNQLTTKLGG